jgi:hypothetical protein
MGEVVVTPKRILLSGPFHAGQRDRAVEFVCEAVRRGARDVLYVTPGGAAKNDVTVALARRECALFGVRVIAADTLAAEIERRARVVGTPRVDSLADRLAADRAAREACREIFSAAAPLDGLARQIAETVELLERSGARPEQLEAEARGMGQGAQVLVRAWTALQALREPCGRSRGDVTAGAIALLRRDPALLAGCELLVLENVSVVHPLDAELTATLISALRGDVVAAVEAPAGLSTAPAALSLVRLRAMAAWDEQALARGAAAADRACEQLFTTVPAKSERPAWTPEHGLRVRLLEAAGDAGEVRLAARVVRRHLLAGAAAEEIQLVVHSAARYRPLIREIFAEQGIPVALAAGIAVAETPIGDVLLRLLRAALEPENVTREEALSIVRTPHLGLGEAQGDRLERTVVREGYTGFSTWSTLPPERIGDRTAQRVERFCAALGEAHLGFVEMRGVDDAAVVVRRLAKRLRLLGNAYFTRMRTLRTAGDSRGLRARTEAAVREDNEAWEEIETVLDRMPELLALVQPEPAAAGLPLARQWLATFGQALRSTGTRGAHAPRGVVRVVDTRVGSAVPARITLVLGLAEGRFPRAIRQDALLTDRLRQRLRERFGWHLPIAEELADHEREAFLRAVLSASEVLYLSRPATDREGRAVLASFYLEDLQRSLPYAPEVEREHVSDLVAHPADAARTGELLASVSHDIWQHLPGPIELRRRALAFHVHDAIVARGAAPVPLTGRREPSLRAVVDPALLEGTPHRTLRLSASQLASIAHCTYKHFLEKVVRPGDLNHPQFDALSRGSLLHDAMLHWGRVLDGWRHGEAALAELDAWIDAYAAALPPSVLGSEAARQELRRSRARLAELLRAELSHLAATGGRGFAPAYHELGFGEDVVARPDAHDPASTPEPLELSVEAESGPRTLWLRGSIDRVDVFTRDGRRYGVAIDYKTGASSKWYAKKMLAGDDLQLRTYLLALERQWGITPVGALFLGFGDGLRHGAVHADFAELIPGVVGSDRQKIEQMDAARWDEFVHGETPRIVGGLTDRIVRLDIVAEPKDGDCGFCAFGRVCRYQKYAEVTTDA